MENGHLNNQARVRQNESGRKNRLKRTQLKAAAIATGFVVALALLVLGGLFLYRSSTGSNIDGAKYQAVFFTNGQVYFGKLRPLNSEYMKLTDIYYLQAKTDSSNPQKTDDSGANVQLIKLGNEIHGPDDEMIISKSQILFFENLKSNSKVSKSIDKYRDGQ
jgi:hypothetical protein